MNKIIDAATLFISNIRVINTACYSYMYFFCTCNIIYTLDARVDRKKK